MKTIVLAATAMIGLGLATGAAAATITSYDIVNAAVSGTGNWSHTYTGTITPTGGVYANYSGGGGSLNDGIIPTSEHGDQLFDLTQPPVITVHLDAPTLIQTIDFLTAYDRNFFVGDFQSVTVTVGANSVTYGLTGFGPTNFRGLNFNQRITLDGLLASTMADSFTLSGLSSFDGGYGSIGEISVNGSLGGGGVPEPGIWALMIAGFGLSGLALRARRARPLAA